MKLIDLLVQELPKRGGWPDGADCCCASGVDSDGVTIQFRFIPRNNQFLFCPDADHLVTPYQGDTTEFITCEVITKEMYQSALTASQKPVWSGEGLPPVGCECECRFLDAWHVCNVLFVGAEVIVGVIDGSERAFSVNHTRFRPLLSEADKKRDEVINEIASMIGRGTFYEDADRIYEAIAAGKIPGVKLDD